MPLARWSEREILFYFFFLLRGWCMKEIRLARKSTHLKAMLCLNYTMFMSGSHKSCKTERKSTTSIDNKSKETGQKYY